MGRRNFMGINAYLSGFDYIQTSVWTDMVVDICFCTQEVAAGRLKVGNQSGHGRHTKTHLQKPRAGDASQWRALALHVKALGSIPPTVNNNKDDNGDDDK
jgi:hypothetical protein